MATARNWTETLVRLLAALVSRHGMWAIPMDEDVLNAWSASGNPGALVFIDPALCAADPSDNAERMMGMCIGVAWHWLCGEARRPDARAHYIPASLVTGVLAEMRALGKHAPNDPQLSFEGALATVYTPTDLHDVGHVTPRPGVTLAEGVGPLRPLRHATLFPNGCGRAKCPTCRDMPGATPTRDEVTSLLAGVQGALHGGTPDMSRDPARQETRVMGDAFGMDGPDAFGMDGPDAFGITAPVVSPTEVVASPLDFAGCVEPCVAFPQCVCGRQAGNGGKL